MAGMMSGEGERTHVKTVLVVDDERSLRLLCRVNLELDGHIVHEAGTLAEARELIDKESLDVILLDVHVGGHNEKDRSVECSYGRKVGRRSRGEARDRRGRSRQTAPCRR